MAEGGSEEVHELPSHTALYLEPSYWNDRFAREDHYEWFKDYSHFRHLILSHISKTDRVSAVLFDFPPLMDAEGISSLYTMLMWRLCFPIQIRFIFSNLITLLPGEIPGMKLWRYCLPLWWQVLEVGCGNSQMGEEIYKDGFTRITRTDLSPIVINLMQKRSAAQGCEGIEYKVADMLDLPFEDNSFDVIIEKGTIDCLFVDSGDPWNPKPEVAKRVKRVLEEIHRVLTPSGMFISIAFGQPHFRRPFFEAECLTWSMKWETFGDSFHYFFYTLKKGTKALHEGPRVAHLPQSTVHFDLEHEFMDNEDYLLHSTIGDDE